jgi:hypothetical protein
MYILRVYTCICEGEAIDVDVGAGVTVSVDVVDMACTHVRAFIFCCGMS